MLCLNQSVDHWLETLSGLEGARKQKVLLVRGFWTGVLTGYAEKRLTCVDVFSASWQSGTTITTGKLTLLSSSMGGVHYVRNTSPALGLTMCDTETFSLTPPLTKVFLSARSWCACRFEGERRMSRYSSIPSSLWMRLPYTMSARNLRLCSRQYKMPSKLKMLL